MESFERAAGFNVPYFETRSVTALARRKGIAGPLSGIGLDGNDDQEG
jgi:hypothetical protein